jgi:hypothetical protein
MPQSDAATHRVRAASALNVEYGVLGRRWMDCIAAREAVSERERTSQRWTLSVERFLAMTPDRESGPSPDSEMPQVARFCATPEQRSLPYPYGYGDS